MVKFISGYLWIGPGFWLTYPIIIKGTCKNQDNFYFVNLKFYRSYQKLENSKKHNLIVFSLFVGRWGDTGVRSQVSNFGKKSTQGHLIIIRQWPKITPI